MDKVTNPIMKRFLVVPLIIAMVGIFVFGLAGCERGIDYRGQSETPTNLHIATHPAVNIDEYYLFWEHDQMTASGFMWSKRQYYSIYINGKILQRYSSAIGYQPRVWSDTRARLSLLALQDGDKVQIRANEFYFTPDGVNRPTVRYSASNLSKPLIWVDDN